jgi:hypothetical protein
LRSEQSMPFYSGSAVQTSSNRWARLSQRQYQNSWTLPTNSQMEKTHIIIRKRDNPKMTDPTNITTRCVDIATMTTTILIAK